MLDRFVVGRESEKPFIASYLYYKYSQAPFNIESVEHQKIRGSNPRRGYLMLRWPNGKASDYGIIF